jgi:hypothetical protein
MQFDTYFFRKCILISLIAFGATVLYGQVVLKEEPIHIRLDRLGVYEKEGITFSVNKIQKEQGSTIPLHLSIEDSTAIYIITSTGFAHGRGFLKKDCEKDQYCEPLLQKKYPISYWKIIVPAYPNYIPKAIYLRLETTKYIIATEIWERAITRIPVSIVIEE